MEGYCWTCGWHTDNLAGELDPATKLCRWCQEHWPEFTTTPPFPPPRSAGREV